MPFRFPTLNALDAKFQYLTDPFSFLPPICLKSSCHVRESALCCYFSFHIRNRTPLGINSDFQTLNRADWISFLQTVDPIMTSPTHCRNMTKCFLRNFSPYADCFCYASCAVVSWARQWRSVLRLPLSEIISNYWSMESFMFNLRGKLFGPFMRRGICLVTEYCRNYCRVLLIKR